MQKNPKRITRKYNWGDERKVYWGEISQILDFLPTIIQYIWWLFFQARKQRRETNNIWANFLFYWAFLCWENWTVWFFERCNSTPSSKWHLPVPCSWAHKIRMPKRRIKYQTLVFGILTLAFLQHRRSWDMIFSWPASFDFFWEPKKAVSLQW